MSLFLRHRGLLLLSILAIACSGSPSSTPAPEGVGSPGVKAADMDDETKKTLYVLGVSVSQGLLAFDVSEAELPYVLQGIEDRVLNRELQVDIASYAGQVQALALSRLQRALDQEKAAGAEFLAQVGAEPGAVTTESGVVIQDYTPGDGPSPGPTDVVTVHYQGSLRDGTVFDSSYGRGSPATIAVADVIPCWQEGIQHMKVGGKSRLLCPPELAYGDQGRPPSILPGATLAFEIELLGVTPGESAETPNPGN